MDAARETRLVALVAQALERRDAGAPVDLATLCADDLELLPAVAEALGMAADLPELQQHATQRDALVDRVLCERYRLLARIGAGAMGMVYRGRDLRLDREVAVKVLHRAPLGSESEARFVREGQILASLAHPHIVPVHDRGVTSDGIAFLVLAFVRGGSFAQWIAAQTPDDPDRVRSAARIALAVAGALAAAHAKGVCHRDVKPSNILVDDDGAAMLVDFGISARAGDQALTATGTTLGTPWYMAPEQILGRVGHEPSVDVYALSATLWHALALRPPYEGDARTVLARIPHEDPPRLDRLCRGVPRDLVAIVEHGMERDPRRRYAGAAQLEADLRSFLAGLPVAARPVGALARGLRALRRRPARYASLALLGLTLAIGGSTLPAYARDRRTQRDAAILAKWIALPPMVTLEGNPEDRPDADRGERDEAAPVLREILALDPEHLPARLLEAALHFDSGRRADAARVMQRVAESRGSPYLAALAARYADATPGVVGARAIRLEELPPAADASDRYCEGFHRLRARSEADLVLAQRALEDAGRELLAARDLHLLALLAVGNSKEGRREESEPWYRRAYDEAVRLEQVYGQATARTRHAIGAALLGLRRYAEAVPPLEESLRLRADRHHVLQNLAIAKRRLGDLEGAEELLRRAHELEPRLWNTTYTLAQVLAERGRSEEAMTMARALEARPGDSLVWKRERLVGSIALARGIEAFAAGDHVPAAAAAGEAKAAFAAAAAAGDPRDTTAERALADAVVAADPQQVWQLYARTLGKDALQPRRLQMLARLLPEGAVARAQIPDLRALFLAIAAALAPEDAALAARARRLASNLPPLTTGK